MLIKNSSDTIGNRTRALPQPTAPPRAPRLYGKERKPSVTTRRCYVMSTALHVLALSGHHQVLVLITVLRKHVYVNT